MDFAGRQARFYEALAEASLDLFFCPPSGDLEYLTGFGRRIPSFGNSEQAHQWTTGAFFRPGREPVFLVIKASAAYKMADGVSGDVIEVDNLSDPFERFGEAIRRIGGGTR